MTEFIKSYGVSANINDVLRERPSDARIINAMSAKIKGITYGKDLSLVSPDGTRWKITVDNSGNLITTAV